MDTNEYLGERFSLADLAVIRDSLEHVKYHDEYVTQRRREFEASLLSHMKSRRSHVKHVVKILAERLGLEPHDVGLGSWECVTSPTGQCVYNLHQDEQWDDCLFCHEPEERK